MSYELEEKQNERLSKNTEQRRGDERYEKQKWKNGKDDGKREIKIGKQGRKEIEFHNFLLPNEFFYLNKFITNRFVLIPEGGKFNLRKVKSSC